MIICKICNKRIENPIAHIKENHKQLFASEQGKEMEALSELDKQILEMHMKVVDMSRKIYHKLWTYTEVNYDYRDCSECGNEFHIKDLEDIGEDGAKICEGCKSQTIYNQ